MFFFKSSLNSIGEFYFIFKNQIRKIYLNSSIYDKKISKVDYNILVYQPSLTILSSFVKYKKQKKKIEDFNVQSIWDSKSLGISDFKKLGFKAKYSIDYGIKEIINWLKKNKNIKFNKLGNYSLNVIDK